MILEYLRAAMHQAQYELMENGRFFGKIPACPGVWADGASLEACRDELHEVLEDWILVRTRLGLEIPIVDGCDLNPKPDYAQANQPA